MGTSEVSAQLPSKFPHDLLGRAGDVGHDGLLIGGRFLEDGELAVKQGRRHEMAATLGEALLDGLG